MSIRNADASRDPTITRLQRKRDQAWELAGLARPAGDTKAEQQHMAAARNFTRQIQETSEQCATSNRTPD